MRAVQNINTLAISLPLLILASYPFINEDAIVYSLLSTLITGVIQIILSIYLFVIDYKRVKIKIYLVCVITFFSIWFISNEIRALDQIGVILIFIPPVLAYYLSNIIYSKSKS